MAISLETFLNKILKKNSFRFIVVGVSSVAIDFTLYMWLVSIDVPTYLSRGASYFITLLYAYFLNNNQLDQEYEHQLAAIGKTDTIIVGISK